MTINLNHPAFTDFIQNELCTLNYLGTNPYITQKFPALSAAATMKYQLYSATKKRGKYSRTFDFTAKVDVRVEGRAKSVITECQVGPGFAPSNYVLSIFDQEQGANRLLRKFHFDYALPVPSQDAKPIYHLQYGGQVTPGLTENNVDIAPILPWLSSPRMFYSPVNLALLFDSLFCEFVSEETNHISESREWRQLILHNERELLRTFYQNVVQFITHSHQPTRLLRDFYYGR